MNLKDEKWMLSGIWLVLKLSCNAKRDSTEVMCQNLVRGVLDEAYRSAHHTDWPQADLAAVDENPIEQMALARRIQAQCKNADFNIEDRITTWYIAEGELVEVFTTWGG